MLHAMIMAGGGGTRFWPRSRSARPKQFLRFSGDSTLLQATWERVEGLIPCERGWVITSTSHAEETRRQLPSLPPDHIVGEPCGRDTAACIGLGAALIAREDPAGVMVAMPADHIIEPAREFTRTIHAASQLAEEHPQALITLGIAPTYPAVGFGYIQRGAMLTDRQGIACFAVEQFREKPKPDVAERYVASGQYYWNSGIFIWKVQALLEELRQHRPGIHAGVCRIADAWGTADQEIVFREEYQKLEKISIDYAVMEPARQVLVMQAPFQWDDVGSWLALERRQAQDAQGNTIEGLHVGIHTSGCVIVSDPGHLIGTIGVRDLLIVHAGNATLVADRKDEATVKDLVIKLQSLPGMEKYL